MTEWQWHQLNRMQIIRILLQTDNHASSSSVNFTDRMLFLMPNQQCQSTTTTPPQPFYGPFSGTIWVSWCQKRTSGLYGARED